MPEPESSSEESSRDAAQTGGQAPSPRKVGDKELVHIAGAGTIGMTILLVSLSILFVASIVAYLVIRHQSFMWPPPGFPHVPETLWLSTFIILLASVTIQLAMNAVRRDDHRRLTKYLFWTFCAGVAFLILQTISWIDFYRAIERSAQLQGAYLGMFFVLTGLHAAHVIGGLIPLGIVYSRAKRERYSRNYHPGVRYVTAYWHFLDVIWVALFLVLYF